MRGSCKHSPQSILGKTSEQALPMLQHALVAKHIELKSPQPPTGNHSCMIASAFFSQNHFFASHFEIGRLKSRRPHILLYRRIAPIWVCLKIGYTPNYSHLIGIMIINHWVQGYTIFRQTHLTVASFSVSHGMAFLDASASSAHL